MSNRFIRTVPDSMGNPVDVEFVLGIEHDHIVTEMRARIERLETALKEIFEYTQDADQRREIAREALEKEK